MSSPEDIIDALLKQRVESRLADLETQLKTQKELLEDIKGERDKALKWGILALGTAVIGMAGWIFNLITTGHLK